MSYGGYGRRRRGGGGFKVRLMIAGAMILFSLFSYMRMGQVNPITGERQRVALDTDEEIAMGLQAAPSMAQQHGGLHPSQPDQQLVDNMGGKLLVALDKWLSQQGKTNPYQFEFHLLRDPNTINAFALPGGQVFVCLLYTSPSPRDATLPRMPSSA